MSRAHHICTSGPSNNLFSPRGHKQNKHQPQNVAPRALICHGPRGYGPSNGNLILQVGRKGILGFSTDPNCQGIQEIAESQTGLKLISRIPSRNATLPQHRLGTPWVNFNISTLGMVATNFVLCRPPVKMNRTNKLKNKKTHAKNSEVKHTDI